MTNRTIEELPKWQKSAPYVRRFVLVTGWLTYLAIPLLILKYDYPVSTQFVAIYSSLGTAVGTAIGFYFYRRGDQDKKITEMIKDETRGHVE